MGAAGRAARANAAWEALLHVHATMMRRFDAQPEVWDGLSMHEYDVLYALVKAGGSARMSGLNRGVLLSQPALSRLVTRLEQRGLVRRGPDADDGRCVAVSLTEAGRQAQRRVGLRHGLQVAQAMEAGLGDDELVQLRRLCERLAARLEAAGSAGDADGEKSGDDDGTY
jgi:DNA-binding MarR family transcriptional regulator